MQNQYLNHLMNGLSHSFIACEQEALSDFTAKALFNDEQTKFASELKQELRKCKHFDICVAFIKNSGLQLLYHTLEEVVKEGVTGRIITTDYLIFTEPVALKRIAQIPNVECRFFETSKNKNNTGFHTKGYIFEDAQNNDLMRLIIGSSNLTRAALLNNKEWNILLASTKKGEIAGKVQKEFNALWDASVPVENVLQSYQKRYDFAKMQRKAVAKLLAELPTTPMNNAISESIVPNAMQKKFIDSLTHLVVDGENKALLVAATGTGKTYAAALALRELDAKKILFIVHREQIAKSAKASFERIFGTGVSTGLISGTHKDFDKDFIFATMQTICKPDVYQRFAKKHFTHIVIDEVHHAGAESYQRILNHFEPDLLLGMTATPFRNDDVDIFKIFDNNVAYTITLQEALENNQLCPFHYYGITDVNVDDLVIEDERAIEMLTADNRAKHILEISRKYGWSGKRVKGLIFCSRGDECEILTQKFNDLGIRAMHLGASDSQEAREKAIERLGKDDEENALDYILTVDIFNEGVDIPAINQVIMLRPTKSAIVFVQQLGRGLRLANEKEFLVVLDFIANYNNNFMIPAALSGDRSYNKDNLRRVLTPGGQLLAGSSTVEFDKISRERIYRSIDKAKTQTKKFLLEHYHVIKNELGRIPKMIDFDRLNGIDPLKFIGYTKESYYSFVKQYDKDNIIHLSNIEERILQFVSKKYATGKRFDEIVILQLAFKYHHAVSFEHCIEQIRIESGRKVSESKLYKELVYMQNLYTNQFPDCKLLKFDDAGFSLCDDLLKNDFSDDFIVLLNDIFTFATERFKTKWSKPYKNTDFVLNMKYTYEDVCRLFNWTKKLNAQNISGYFYDKTTKTLPVFINYEKEESAIAYEDKFLNPSEIVVLSTSGRKTTSPDADHIFKRTEDDRDNKIYLFVRKNKADGEAKEFYFLGEIDATGEPIPDKMPDGKDVFKVHYRLQHPVDQDIYEYITKG